MINNTQAELEEPTTPPGMRLKIAREAKGLDQSDIAKELRLDLPLIEALEQGDVDHLPLPVYTAGYIRSYAKLMDLPADNMVADYVALKTKDLPSLPKRVDHLPDRYRRVAEALPKSFSIATANSRNVVNVQYAAIGFGIFLVVLIAWQSTRLLSNDKVDSPVLVVGKVQQGIHDQQLPAESLPTISEQSAKPPPPQKIIADTTTSQQQTQGKTKIASIANTSTNANTSITNTSTETESSSGEQLLENKPPTKYIEKRLDLKTLDSLEGGEALALLEKENTTDLILNFRRNSWVDIRDSTGKRLIRRLGIAGNSQIVSGIAPFQVLLGYGHGVSIEYNGKRVDFSAYQGDRVARFTLEVPKDIERVDP